MRLRQAFPVTLAAFAWLGSSLPTQTAAPAAEFTPQEQSLAIPVSIAGKPANAVQCVVSLGPTVGVSAVAFSDDGKTLAVGGYREVLIWDLENATLSKRVGTGQMGTGQIGAGQMSTGQIGGAVGALAFLKDGTLAVGEGSPYGSGAVRIFDLETGQQVHAFEEPADVVYCLATSPDGKLLAAGGADALARVWSIDEKKLVATLRDHTDWVLGASFSRDGKLLATSGADRNVLIWDVQKWESTLKLREDDVVQGAAFGSDGKSLVLAVGGSNRRTLQIRRMDNVRSKRALSTGAGMPLDVVWTGKANQMYVPCSDGVVRIYQAFGRLLASLTGHQDWVYCLALSPDETKLATGSADGTVKLWDAVNNRLIATLVQLRPRTDDWLILTSEGFFAGSSPDALKWKAAGPDPLPEDLIGGLDNPEKVREALSKIATPPSGAKKRSKSQPKKRPPKQKPGD